DGGVEEVLALRVKAQGADDVAAAPNGKRGRSPRAQPSGPVAPRRRHRIGEQVVADVVPPRADGSCDRAAALGQRGIEWNTQAVEEALLPAGPCNGSRGAVVDPRDVGELRGAVLDADAADLPQQRIALACAQDRA